MDGRKLPLPVRIFGVLCVVASAAFIVLIILVAPRAANYLSQDADLSASITVTILFIMLFVCLFGLVALPLVLGIMLFRGRRRFAANLTTALMALTATTALCDILLNGLVVNDIFYALILALLFFISGYIDPSLAGERQLQRRLRLMEDRSLEELGEMEGRDLTGKGYVELNFFNLFWVFIICCVIGVFIETIYCFFINGELQDRAGLLFGPFSPIYGFGGLLLTLTLNRFYKSNLPIIFLVSAFIGGSFEYLTSWFMQTAFGIIAWDYSGTWLSIDGRTNGVYMIMWGLLGVFWIKLLVPGTLKLIVKIPWQLRYTATAVGTVFIAVNIAMTLIAFDCWFERKSGNAGDVAIQQFFNDNFDDKWMQNRFQNMSLYPEDALRSQ
ncbi:MAG TPA: hypothetical protein DEB24_07225 [Coriobacteriia bacterium]|nr:hypothetical protein [Coriobacteriia bacterium]